MTKKKCPVCRRRSALWTPPSCVAVKSVLSETSSFLLARLYSHGTREGSARNHRIQESRYYLRAVYQPRMGIPFFLVYIVVLLVYYYYVRLFLSKILIYSIGMEWYNLQKYNLQKYNLQKYKDNKILQTSGKKNGKFLLFGRSGRGREDECTKMATMFGKTRGGESVESPSLPTLVYFSVPENWSDQAIRLFFREMDLGTVQFTVERRHYFFGYDQNARVRSRILRHPEVLL